MKRSFTETFCTFVREELRRKYLDSVLCRSCAELSILESLVFIMRLLHGPILQTYRPNLGCESDAFSLLWSHVSAESGLIYVNICVIKSATGLDGSVNAYKTCLCK